MQDRMHVHPQRAWTPVHLPTTPGSNTLDLRTCAACDFRCTFIRGLIVSYSTGKRSTALDRTRLAAGGFPVLLTLDSVTGRNMSHIYNGMPAAELTDVSWQKSKHSNPNGACVEVAHLPGGEIAMRNSRFPDGPALVYTA